MLTVSIPVDIQCTLRAALREASTAECGGVLMGEHVGPDLFAVRALTVQGGGSFASFVRNARAALRALAEFFRRSNEDFARFNYLGEWHSHPSFTVNPSGVDHRSMLDIATNPDVRANFVVLLIFKLGAKEELEGSAHTYLPDGSIWPSTLVFEGLS
jgi:integrative and conjugative element protein (TIGR02256 family)